MIDIEGLRKRVENRLSRYRSRIAEADGKGVGTGETDVTRMKEKVKQADSLLQPGWSALSEDTLSELEQWLEEVEKEDK